jgi:2-polyprenyl-3-methyl-5-hydroxy-6-metoxy-1,4-benzoquinol methylase
MKKSGMKYAYCFLCGFRFASKFNGCGMMRGGAYMREQAAVNKTAWEYRAYEFWTQQASPIEKAASLKADPLARFHFHRQYFQNISGKRIANPCGSNGRMAVPLALLGADVTVFDISEENKRYALELAKEASVEIQFVLGDFCEADLTIYGEAFDVVYAEGGITHYFSDIDVFTRTLYSIIKDNGALILSDFHPYRKMNRAGSPMISVSQTDGSYFDAEIHCGNVAYQPFFPQEEQDAFPKCLLRFYTMSEIINSVIESGFVLKEFLEHPSYEDKKLPGLFTIIAHKTGR